MQRFMGHVDPPDFIEEMVTGMCILYTVYKHISKQIMELIQALL